MSMSTYVEGLRDPDSDRHRAMVAAAKALYNAGIYELPKELKEYFKGYYETSEVVGDEFSGLEVDIKNAVEETSEREMCNDWIVDLRKLPEGVTHIRFTNSY